MSDDAKRRAAERWEKQQRERERHEAAAKHPTKYDTRKQWGRK